MIGLFILLITFQVKHFLADYIFQGRFMLGKFNPGWDFFAPLAAHAGVHAAMTLGIVLCVYPSLWWLALVDGVTHFIIDRIKAGPKWLGRFSDKNKPPYWFCLGGDQMAHFLIQYAIIAALVS